MDFNFLTKNYTLTPSEEKVIAKKARNIQNLVKKFKGNHALRLEIEEFAKADDLGNKYRCEVNFTFYDKSIYIDKANITLRNSIDDCFSELKNKIVKDNKKHKTKIKRDAFKNKYAFLSKMIGRKGKNSSPYDNIE